MAKNKNVNIALNRFNQVCAFQKDFLRSSLFCNFGTVKLISEGIKWKRNFPFNFQEGHL